MAHSTWLRTVALALVLVVGPASAATVVGQPAVGNGGATADQRDAGENRTAAGPNASAPPGVHDGRLVNETALLDAHTDRLTRAGFTANGSAELAVVRRGILVDVTRTENRTVASNASEYRRSSTDVARTGFGRVTRERAAWGNRTVETTRTVERGQTSFGAEQPAGDRRLAGARRMGNYLRAGTFTVADTRIANGSSTPNGSLAPNGSRAPNGSVAANGTGPGERARLYVLRSTGETNRTLLRRVLPRGASNPRNFTATAVVDEAGRVRSFRASVDYTIQGKQRTKRVAFTLQSLGVTDVRRPPWVDEALARRGGTAAGGV